MNRRLLVICYYFPPLGLGGVGRPLMFFKYLHKFGWDCHILTVKPVAYRAYEPELLHGLDISKIFRAGSRDPQRLLYLLGVRRVKEKAANSGARALPRFFPDSKVGWVKPAVRLGERLLQTSRYDAILSSSPPVSAHLVALGLQRRFALPWIADFRDFWGSFTLEETYRDPRKLDRAKALIRTIAEKSSLRTAVSASIAEAVGGARVITNSYDPETAAQWRAPDTRAPFTIGVLGSIGDDLPIEPLLKVLTQVRVRSGDEDIAFRIVQVGNADSAALEDLLFRYNLCDQTQLHGLQPRARTIELLSDTSLMYIGLRADITSRILPGRLFDLLASGRPILAAVSSDSAISELLSNTGNNFCFDESSIDDAADYLTALIQRRQRGDLRIEPRPPYAERYSGDQMAGAFAQLLGELV